MENLSLRIVRAWRRLGTRNGCVALLDALLLSLAAYVSYALRFSIFLEHAAAYGILEAGPLYVAAVMFSFYIGGIYRVYWLQMSIEELLILMKAYLLACAVLIGLYMGCGATFVVPRSVMGMLFLCGFVFLVLPRLLWRLTLQEHNGYPQRRTLIVGAGEAGVLLARELRRHNSDFNIVGFLDDDLAKSKKMVAGIPVLGTLHELISIVGTERVSDVLVALPSVPAFKSRRLLNELLPLKSSVRILPSLQELADGTVSLDKLRKVRFEDLLPREPVSLDPEQIGRLLCGRTVLLSGAGGSIGSEIVRQILPYAPAALVLLGHGEFSIYTLLEELRESACQAKLVPVIADVADERAMEEVFSRWRPDIVFHAAAHKHVPLMECNAREAIRTNALGTWIFGRMAGRYETKRFVMISTDKAVNPNSVMGASKRIAEMALMELQRDYPQTAYMAVRFGNVLGSRGSVVPKFERQIAAGGPVTVTHPRMVRYFMLIPEAAGLVLQTAAIGLPGRIYVLDMGKPVNIAEVARTMIRLNGYEPDRDVKVVYTGIRPGEKLSEELFYDEKHVEATSHPKIFCAKISAEGHVEVRGMLVKIKTLLEEPEIMSSLAKFVPEYRSSDKAAEEK